MCVGTADKGVILHLFLFGLRPHEVTFLLVCPLYYVQRKGAQLPGNPTHPDTSAVEKKRKGKRWIFFDENRYKRAGVLVGPSFVFLLLPFRPGAEVFSGFWRTFQVMSHQRKRVAATAQLCAIFCLFCRRNRRKRNFKNSLMYERAF